MFSKTSLNEKNTCKMKLSDIKMPVESISHYYHVPNKAVQTI